METSNTRKKSKIENKRVGTYGNQQLRIDKFFKNPSTSFIVSCTNLSSPNNELMTGLLTTNEDLSNFDSNKRKRDLITLTPPQNISQTRIMNSNIPQLNEITSIRNTL